jgi:hypothetical protein
MSSKYERELVSYVAAMLEELGLSRWHVETKVVEYPGVDDETNAVTVTTDGRLHAVLELSPLALRPAVELRQTVTHELIHLALRDAVDVVRLGAQRVLSPGEYALLWECFRQAFELAVDELATAVSPHLPTAPELAVEAT